MPWHKPQWYLRLKRPQLAPPTLNSLFALALRADCGQVLLSTTAGGAQPIIAHTLLELGDDHSHDVNITDTCVWAHVEALKCWKRPDMVDMTLV